MFILVSFSPLGEKCAFVTKIISYVSSYHVQRLTGKIWFFLLIVCVHSAPY